ncbi:hypothetical protein PV10_05806 [Exophiala mesophila]|uniref:Uncharacterized protein n=1 Tax=Exophiala mesophila TaxID=212818 RepID=A0A0D1WQ96_EXOME|nr:uncharacterized protein PV10_05806 [Exophiala mesophila]KIV91245.1 hypothetical protein PV10_05806 [Exophiala mesophila]
MALHYPLAAPKMTTKIMVTQPPLTRNHAPCRRRRIPLTAFTLLTVPEEPTLSTYLDSKERVDISLMQRMVTHGTWSTDSVSFAGVSFSSRDSVSNLTASKLPTFLEAKSDQNMDLDQDFDLDLDLDLEVSIAAITLTECPRAVKKTIVWSRQSRFAENASRDHR